MVSGALFCLGGGGLDIIFRGHYFCWVGVVGHYFWVGADEWINTLGRWG